MTKDERTLYEWEARMETRNRRFIGYKPDEEKLARLNRLRAICRRIAELDESIENPFLVFSNKNRNGGAQLLLPELSFLTDRRVISLLAALLAEADDVTISSLSGDGVCLTVGVENMWAKFGYEDEGPEATAEEMKTFSDRIKYGI